MEHNTRVYYTGDMANSADEGTICRVNNDPKWGLSYDIVLDDGRLLRSISYLHFNAGIGRRFYPLDEWQALRQERIKKMLERHAQRQA